MLWPAVRPRVATGCNCRRRLICRADNLAHRLHLPILWLCGRHERNITG